NSYNSNVTGLPAGESVTLRWTITHSSCPPSSDDVVISRANLPDVADAGSDIVQCNNGTFTMAANAPTSGTGSWSVVSGPPGFGMGNIANPGLYNTQVTGLPAGTSATLRWTISVPGCPQSSTSDVTIQNVTPPSAAIAGADILQCDDASFTMGATAPVTGTGTWTVISGG